MFELVPISQVLASLVQLKQLSTEMFHNVLEE